MIAAVDALLRAEGRHRVGGGAVPWDALLPIALVSGALYGAVMGSYAGPLQAVYSALKVPLLLATATLACLPFFFVLNLALGLAQDFTDAVRGILSAQATLAACLASLAPVTGLFYLSTDSYPFALLLNAVVFGIAALGAQRTLARHYGPLVAKDPVHARALATWFLLYAFVSVKIASLLRPFVGDPGEPTEFFREAAFEENPYASLFWTAAALLHRLLAGS
jgi:hypothetical protein